MAHLIKFPGTYAPPPVVSPLPGPRHAIGDTVETIYGTGTVQDRWWDGRSYTYRVKRLGGAALYCAEDTLQAAQARAATVRSPLVAPADLARYPATELGSLRLEVGHLFLSVAAAMGVLVVVAFLAKWGVL